MEAAAGRRIGSTCKLTEATEQVGDIEETLRSKLNAGTAAGNDSSTSGASAGAAAGSAVSAAITVKRKRTWWAELLQSLDGDDQFLTSLQCNIQQGEAAYRKYVKWNI